MRFIILAALSLFSGCLFNDKIQINAGLVAAPAGTSSVSFTSPLSDTIVKSATHSFTWTTNGGSELRLTNTFQVNVYSQAACAGTSISSTYTDASAFTLTGILDRRVYSIGVSAFTPVGVQGPEACSSAITGDAIISMLQLAGAHLSLDVDFTNKMAYLGANHATSAITAVDFSTESAPVLFRTLGTGTVPVSTATGSRGIALYNNGTRLLVTGSTSTMELWDLTSDPRGTWTRLNTLTNLSSARKIANVDTTNPATTVVTVALRSGIAAVEIAEPSGVMTRVRNSTALPAYHGAGALMGNWMISPNYNTSAPLALINLTTLAVDATYPFPDQGFGTLMWAAASNPSGTKGFSAGFVGGFFSYNPATPAVAPVNTMRYYSSDTYVTRDATYVSENGKDLFYAVSGIGGRPMMNVWDATDINSPQFVGQQELTGLTSEGYGVRVDGVNHRAYVATSGGQFFIVNTEMIPPPTGVAVPY